MRSPVVRAAWSCLALAAAGLSAVPAVARAQSAMDAPIPVQVGRLEPGLTQKLTLPLNKSAVVDLPVDVRDVVLGSPDVAEAVVRTPRRVFLMGLKPGTTNAYFLDAMGRQILALDIRVAQDTATLDDLVRRLAPDARVSFEAVNDGLIVSGEAPSVQVADRVMQIARRFVEKPENAINLISVRGSQQVLLRVRVVEMQRTIVKQLGVNLNLEDMLQRVLPEDTFLKLAMANGFSIAGRPLGGLDLRGGWASTTLVPQTYSFGNIFSPGDPSRFGLAGSIDPQLAGVGGFARDFIDPARPDLGFRYTFGPGQLSSKQQADAAINALERVGVLRTLAEPNVTAVSGEAARFLVGGEFPVPISQDNDRISTEFKPFGVGLAFTPVVLSEGRISLKVSTEVSELTNQGAFTTGDRVIRDADGVNQIVRGLTIPALSVRRVESTTELPSGGSIVLAGLIQQRTRQAIEGLPGAKDLPVLGNLFRSRDFQNDETELVIIITPYLVNPVALDQLQTPADGFAPATDSETLFLGRINRTFRTPGADTGERRLRGPFGHILP